MISYWEQQSFSFYDHVVIGSGIVGLSVAIELKDNDADARVLVLERGLLPTGATTRNAGFACMGSLTELLDDMKTMSEEDVLKLFSRRKKGLELLRKRLGDKRIGYKANGSYELISEKELPALEKLDYLNDLLMPITGKAAYKLENEKIERFGFSTNHTKAIVENTCEGELHSGKMMRALTDLAIQKGVEIKTGAEVVRFEEDNHNVTLFIKDPLRNEEWHLKCSTMSICTNAFTKQLLPDVDVTPGRGQVVITKPVHGLKFKGIFHFDEGFYYFREIDGRVLFGGGRNLDIEGEATTEFALTELIQKDLEQKLTEVILPGTPYEIDMRWSGIMAFGADKQPIVKAFSRRVFGAFRMGGMGVALGSHVAAALSKLNRDFWD